MEISDIIVITIIYELVIEMYREKSFYIEQSPCIYKYIYIFRENQRTRKKYCYDFIKSLIVIL